MDQDRIISQSVSMKSGSSVSGIRLFFQVLEEAFGLNKQLLAPEPRTHCKDPVSRAITAEAEMMLLYAPNEID